MRILLVLAVLIGWTANPAHAFVVAKDGKPACPIVVADDALPAEETAARELADHLKLVTGADFPILDKAPAGAAILVGPSDAAKQLLPDVKWDQLGHDGIVLRTTGDKLLLAGGRPRGTLYAVYTFLEDTVGVRWWTSTERSVPSKPTLDVGVLNTVYTPKLVYRESFNEDVLHAKYVQAARLKLNGHFSNIPPDHGGHYDIIGWCHTSYDLIPPDFYFKDHPEWFSLRNGKRNPDGGQLCWTNPQLQKEVARRALHRIRKNPSAGIISISQNDQIGNCQCDVCKSIDDREGTAAASLITGINAIAEIIGKEYPDFLVETLAYQYTRHAPKTIKPARNVLVRLCSIECDFTKPLASDANKSFADDMRHWSAISENLFVWNYVTNFANYLQPHPNLTNLAADIRFFTDNRTVGLFEQGDAYNRGAGDMLPLRCWLLAHLMWDPSRDPEKLVDEFLAGYFGPAAPHLRQYLDRVNAVARQPGVRVGCYAGDARFLDDATVSEALTLFDRAADAVKNDPTLSARVARERIAIDNVRLQRYPFQKRVAELRATLGSEDAAAERVAKEYKTLANDFCAAARKFGVVNLSEAQGFDSYEPGLIMKYEAAVPPKFPNPGEPIPPNAIEIQQDRFKLYRKGELSSIVGDPKASDGKAARMPGGITDWAVQFHIPNDPKFNAPGPWRCYLLVRTEGKKDKAAPGFTYGLYPASTNSGGADRTDDEYHPYGMYLTKLTPGSYFWVAPTGPVTAVYVDRIYLVREDNK